MGWIKADYYKRPNCALLTLPLWQQRREAPLLPSEDPEATAVAIEALILKHRPELVGGMLIGFQIDYNAACWRFFYEHKSLPSCADMDEPVRLPLIPDAQADVVVAQME